MDKKRNRCIVAAASLLLATNVHALPYTFQSIDVPFASASETEVFEVSNRGTAVGSYTDEAGMRRGFVLESGAYSTIDVPASATRLFGVIGLGQTVGVCQSRFYRANSRAAKFAASDLWRNCFVASLSLSPHEFTAHVPHTIFRF